MRLWIPLLLAGRLAAQVTTVGSCLAGGSSNGFTTASTNTTGATLFVLTVGTYGGSPCSGSVSDKPNGVTASNNIWTCIASSPAGGNVYNATWYSYRSGSGALATGSGHTFTFTQGGAYPGIVVQAFAGTMTTSDPLETHHEAATGSGSSIQPGSITPAATDLIVSGVTFNGGSSYSVSTPLTTTANCITPYSSGAHEGAGLGYQLSASGSAVNPTWSNGGSNAAASIAAFKAAPCRFTSTAGYLSLAFVGQPYSYIPGTQGCTSPTFSISSGSLPPGLTLDPSTGAITGTPTSTGTSSFTLQGSGALGSQADQIKVGTVAGTAVQGNSATTVRGFWTTNEAGDTKMSCTDGTTTWSTPVVDPIQAGSGSYWGVTAHAISLVVYHPAGPVTCTGYTTYVVGGQGSVALGAATVLAAPTTNPVKIANDAARTRYKMTWNGNIGSSGDIKFPTWAADGSVVVASNDSFGMALSSNSYCCSGHFVEEKWSADMRSSVTMLGGSIGGVTGNLPFGGTVGIADIGWVIAGGNCSGNVATLTFASQGWTPPVGAAIWVKNALPALFNVSGVAVTAATATSLSYPASCATPTSWTSGGQVNVWNDGTFFINATIFSIAGTIYIMPYRFNSNNQYLIKSNDYWNTSLSNAHNSPTATPYNGWDVPLPTDSTYFPAGNEYFLRIIQPCQDYGGAGMTQFGCTWAAGDDSWIYALRGVDQTVSSGYQLWRMKYEDMKLMDGTKWQVYQCAQADTDVGLQDSCWLPWSTGNVATGTVLNSAVNAWGNSIDMNYLPAPFQRFVQIEWSAIKGAQQNISQSAGAILYDHGSYPWGTAQIMGSINGDPADLNYNPTWARCYNSTYSVVSSNPPAARLTCGMSGSYLNGGSGGIPPASNEYGPSNYELYLTARDGGSVSQFRNPSLAYPRLSFFGGGSRHISSGMELFYDWTSCLTAGSVWKNLALAPSGNWDTNLSPTQTMICDSLGLRSFGFPTRVGTFGSANTATTVPMQFVVGTAFNKALNDFTILWVGKHLPAASDGPVNNECAFSSATLGFCRNGQAANSWTFTTPDGTSPAVTVTTDGSNFAAAVMSRSGGTTTFYSNAGIPNAGALTPLATLSGSTSTGTNPIYLGGKNGPAQVFWGYMSYFAIWSRALQPEELRAELGRLRAEIAKAGGTLP